MDKKQIIIDDQKKTIHRLQDECTEKTNAIIALGEQLKAKEQECEELKKILNEGCLHNLTLMTEQRVLLQNLTEIKEIAELFCNACQEFEPEKRGRNCMYCNYGKILQKIKEVLNGTNP